MRTSVYPVMPAMLMSLLLACTSAPQSPPIDKAGARTPPQSLNQTTPQTADPGPATPVETETTAAVPADRIAVLPAREEKFAGMSAGKSEPGQVMAESAPGLATLSAMALPELRAPSEALDRENYAHLDRNGVVRVAEHPVSTFSIDVDTGSYANVRRMLREGRLPPKDAVRAEEMINYFDYHYSASTDSKHPFLVHTEAGPNPWNPHTRLLQIGIEAKDMAIQSLPAANLVFLVDVSGSMQSPDKLDLLKNSLKLLTGRLRKDDRISLVVYAGASGVILEPTGGDEKRRIMHALDQLTAGGSTNGAAGIRLAYDMAQQGFIEGGINRILLATDGDFNVGTVSFEALKNLVEEKRHNGVSLTTLGFGTGNYNDHLMEQLADAGNGNYAYIDTLNEAQKVLIDQMSATFNIVAKDVKIQIEFNPQVVAEYRLIGYENRLLQREDFANDKVDAGEVGAGHSVTALYEITLVGSQGTRIPPLRYGQEMTASGFNDELAFLKLRYKPADRDSSTLMSYALHSRDIRKTLAQTSDEFRFAASVAAFAELLHGGKYAGNMDFNGVMELARAARGQDAYGYRSEFLGLVNLARSLSGEVMQTSKRSD